MAFQKKPFTCDQKQGGAVVPKVEGSSVLGALPEGKE